MKPTIGRIVHFVDDAMEHKAALIVEIDTSAPSRIRDGVVSLSVFAKAGSVEAARLIPYDAASQNSWTWHWPEREEE